MADGDFVPMRGTGCVVGTGPLGRSVLDALLSRTDPPTIRGLLNAGFDETPIGRWIRGVPVLGSLSVLPRYRDELSWAVVALPAGAERENVTAAVRAAGLSIGSVCHDSSVVSSEATVSAGAIVGALATVGVDARLGLGAVIGSGSVIDANATIGDFADVGIGSMIASGARVGERAMLGAGVKVHHDVLIGPDASIEPGAVVVRDIAAGTRFGSGGTERSELDEVM